MTPDDLDWQEQAACRDHHDPDLFFASTRADRAKARAICDTCLVSTECLAMAVRLKVYWGIFGGHTMKEGRPLRRPKPKQPKPKKEPAPWPRPGTAGGDVLRVLLERPGLTQAQVGELAGCSPGRVKEVKRRATAAGLLPG